MTKREMERLALLVGEIECAERCARIDENNEGTPWPAGLKIQVQMVDRVLGSVLEMTGERLKAWKSRAAEYYLDQDPQ